MCAVCRVAYFEAAGWRWPANGSGPRAKQQSSFHSKQNSMMVCKGFARSHIWKKNLCSFQGHQLVTSSENGWLVDPLVSLSESLVGMGRFCHRHHFLFKRLQTDFKGSDTPLLYSRTLQPAFLPAIHVCVLSVECRESVCVVFVRCVLACAGVVSACLSVCFVCLTILGQGVYE